MEINSKKINISTKTTPSYTYAGKVPFFYIKANNGKFFSTFDREDIFKLTKQP